MAKPLLSDDLWSVIEPLLPTEPPKPRGGRPRIPDRKVLTGILFVLRSGIPWPMLPPEMGCGSGMTCWRRLKAWHEAGVWTALHHTLLNRLGEAEIRYATSFEWAGKRGSLHGTLSFRLMMLAVAPSSISSTSTRRPVRCHTSLGIVDQPVQ